MLLRRRVDFERRMQRLPPVTLAIVVLLAAIFLVEAAVEVLDSPEAFLLAGALSREAVLQGEWWRLVSAIFLHGGVEHLIGNAVALFVLGMVCEHAFGRGQFVVLYVLSGLGGSLVSVLRARARPVGVGCDLRPAGAAIVLLRRQRDRLLVRDRRVGFVLLIWAIYRSLVASRIPTSTTAPTSAARWPAP